MAAFEPYAVAHWSALALVLAGALVVYRFGRRDRGAAARWAALLLIAHEVVNVAVHVGLYDYPWRSAIPLNFCRANMLLCAYMLWRRSYGAFEIAYFWGVVGAPVALLAPALEEPFPHPLFFTFFVGHALALFAVLYAVAAIRFAPALLSVAKSFAAALLLAAVAIPVNSVLNTNYLYLAAPPEQSGLVTLFEPWPGYPVGFALLGLVAGILAYLSFAVNMRRSMSESNDH